VLEPKGATVVATYTDDYYAGKPAITLNRCGKGQVVYVGALGDGRLYEGLAGWLCDLVAVRPLLNAAEGIEVTERWQGDQRLLFVLNHTESEQSLALDERYVNLLGSSKVLQGTVTLMPREVLLLADLGETRVR
jgi:beta-galactosidase